MRNLKRVLSLALALVMMLSLMIVGAGAKEVTKKDFTDADEISYTEAVDVMVALEVIAGTDTGAFNPKGTLTREAAAKIVCYMLLGPENAEKLTTNTQIFTDVAAGRWSAGYIAYCANLDILAGTGDGSFNPEGQLTGVAFGKMLLIALGYDPAIEGYVGKNWSTAIATDMIDAGIDVKGTTLSDPLTREQAAQMAFQTLEADMVRYANKGTNVTSSDGTTIIVGASDATPVSAVGSQNYNSATVGTHDELYQQFCEKYFSDLSKDTTGDNGFGRPVNEWKLSNNTVGKYETKTPVVTYNTNMSTKANDVSRDLRSYTFTYYDTSASADATVKGNSTTDLANDDTVSVTANGATSNVATGAAMTISEFVAGLTGDGKIVEIYADKNNNVTAIVTLSYVVDTIDSIVESKDGDYRKTTYTGKDTSLQARTFTDPDKDNTAILYGDIDEDDVVTYVELSNGEYHIYPTEKVVGAQSAKNNKTITVDGTKYNVGLAVSDDGASGMVAMADFANSKDDANYYVDVNGFVVKTTAVDKDTHYAVIDKIAVVGATGTAGNQSVEAILVFADGTKATVNVTKVNDIKAKDVGTSTPSVSKNASNAGSNPNKVTAINISTTAGSNDTLFQGALVKYTVDGDDYEITLLNLVNGALSGESTRANIYTNEATTTANNAGSANHTVRVTVKGQPKILGYNQTNAEGGTVATNNDTVFIVASKDGDDTKYTSYTGFREVPTVKVSNNGATAGTATVAYAVDKNGNVDFVFIDATDDNANAGDTKTGRMLYMTGTNWTTVGTGSNQYYEIRGIVDGEEDVTVMTKSTTVRDGLSRGSLYELTENTDGYITAVTLQDATDTSKAYTKVLLDETSDEAKGGVVAGYTYDDDTKVIVIDDNELAGSNINAAKQWDTIYVKVEDKNASDAKAVTIDTIYIVKGSAPAGSISGITSTAKSTSTATNTASTTVDGTVLKVAAGGTWADGNTITITPTLSAGASMTVNDVAATDIVLTRASGSWAAAGAIVVTGADGSTTTYTTTVTEKNNLATISQGASTPTTSGGSGATISVAPGAPTSDNESTVVVSATADGSGYTNGDTIAVALTMATGATKESGSDSITLTWNGSKWTWPAGTLVVKSQDESTTITYSWAAST